MAFDHLVAILREIPAWPECPRGARRVVVAVGRVGPASAQQAGAVGGEELLQSPLAGFLVASFRLLRPF